MRGMERVLFNDLAFDTTFNFIELEISRGVSQPSTTSAIELCLTREYGFLLSLRSLPRTILRDSNDGRETSRVVQNGRHRGVT